MNAEVYFCHHRGPPQDPFQLHILKRFISNCYCTLPWL